MAETQVTRSEPEPDEIVYVNHVTSSPEASSFNFIAVLIALVLLIGVVALIFYGLPTWVGGSSVNVNIRT